MSNLELNKGDNFIFAIDVSGSMATADCPVDGDGNLGASRINFSREKVIQFIGAASEWDADGVDLIAFGHEIKVFPKTTKENAAEIVGGLQATQMSTDTAGAVRAAYKLHKDGGYQQTVLFVDTDGEPNDQDALLKAIADITNDVKDEREFNISFLTVGKRSDGLEAFLKVLDDKVPGAKYDIVDVKTLEEVDFISAFAGALND